MDFSELILAHASKIMSQTQYLKTEAATSTTLVLPFLAALGYNVFDPTEVEPEFSADVGNKKGEKVDYAIKVDGKPIVLIEVKHWETNLGEVHASQLFRYFNAEESVRFAILTNGIVYRFYADLEAANRMDEDPFFVVDLLQVVDASPKIRDGVLEALRKFAKGRFDPADVAETAGELKYKTGISKYLNAQLQGPDDDFVALLTKQVYSGNLTKSVRERFVDIVKRAFQDFINEKVDARLQSAIKSAPEPEQGAEEDDLPAGVAAIDGDIVTTEEEVEGFRIVRAIMGKVVDSSRVFMRDTKSYCGIILDDNNRKPICRFWFEGPRKYLGLFDASKSCRRVALERIESIYDHADELRAVVSFYEGKPEPQESADDLQGDAQ
jgi:hypothetical protein